MERYEWRTVVMRHVMRQGVQEPDLSSIEYFIFDNKVSCEYPMLTTTDSAAADLVVRALNHYEHARL